jgi:hypothetical protein
VDDLLAPSEPGPPPHRAQFVGEAEFHRRVAVPCLALPPSGRR